MSKNKAMHEPLRQMLTRRGIVDPESIMPFTLLSNARLKAIVSAVDMARSLPGDTAEIGCHAGGTSSIIGSINGGKRHWAVDTFAGLQDVCEKDGHMYNGQFSAERLTLQWVKQRLAPLKNVTVIEGFFPECAAEMSGIEYSFVHIDVDSYASMRTCIDYFIARMCDGGIIAMDDVIGCGTPGGKMAWAETDKSHLAVISENDPQVIVRVSK
jgi:hypothetical protein